MPELCMPSKRLVCGLEQMGAQVSTQQAGAE